MEYQLKVQEIEVTVRLKKIKNVHLSVHPPVGTVTVSAPEDMEPEKIRTYLATKLTWIRKQQKKIGEQPRENEHLLITRERHYFLGKRYLLNVEETAATKEKSKVKKHQDRLDLIVPQNSGYDFRNEVLQKWYRTELRKIIEKMLKKHAPKMDLSVPRFSVRAMKTKWGSCNDKAGTLLFNTELAKKPQDCIEYIVVHELVHLLVRNHNTDFIILMDKFLPNWRLRKKELNELPVKIL